MGILFWLCLWNVNPLPMFCMRLIYCNISMHPYVLTENNQNARFIAVHLSLECIFFPLKMALHSQADDDLIFLIFWRDQFNKKILGIFMHEIEKQKQKHRVSFRLIQWQQWVLFFLHFFPFAHLKMSISFQYRLNSKWKFEQKKKMNEFC